LLQLQRILETQRAEEWHGKIGGGSQVFVRFRADHLLDVASVLGSIGCQQLGDRFRWVQDGDNSEVPDIESVSEDAGDVDCLGVEDKEGEDDVSAEHEPIARSDRAVEVIESGILALRDYKETRSWHFLN
jgi:hypothetical protein